MSWLELPLWLRSASSGSPISGHHPSGEILPSLWDGAKPIVQIPTLRNITATSSIGQIGPGALAVVAAVLAAFLSRPASAGWLLTVR